VALKYVALTVVSAALAVLMTWPLGRVSHAIVPASDDAYFSIWRLAWVAHQLPEDPAHLFDANIFHPATNTLALSDAMVLVGVFGTPLFRAGVNPAIIHNYLLLAAIVTSMLCAFALARRLSGSDAASWLAAIVFGLGPYRMAHIGHLELQWTMWMPLGLLLLHRLLEKPAPWRGMLLGAALAAQMLCSIYYGVFLACYLTAAWLALVPFERAKGRIAAASAFAIIPLLLVGLIYGPPYARTSAQVGERRAEEVRAYSAVPGDYLRVPQENVLRGRVDQGEAPDERSLFPGFIAIGLAIVAFIPPLALRSAKREERSSRMAFTYLGLAVLSADLSFGTNGVLFSLLQNVFGVASLRAPARFGVLVLLSIGVLAAIGARRVYEWRPRLAPFVSVALTLLCLGEYWSSPIGVREFDPAPTEAEAWLARYAPGTVLLEMPAPAPDTLWRHEAKYQLRSIHHWQPLVNGYSAFPPQPYIALITELQKFPQRDAIVALRERGVKYILVHREFYEAEEFDRLMQAIEESTRVTAVRTFGENDKRVVVVELNYDPE
jgi:hypothetical protein